MTKKKKDQKKTKPLLSWGMQDSQKSILLQAQERYKSEVGIIRRYQQDQFLQFLKEIKKELGIPNEIDVRFNGKAMTFIEVPPQPKPSPTTQDLTKVPTV